MRTGPHTTPTAVKQALGNPGKRPLNRAEPKPRVGLPACPAWFDDERRQLWEVIGSRLVRLGVMTENDGESLGDLVRSEALMHEIDVRLKRTAPVKRTKTGTIKNPLWSLAIELLRERRAQHEKFGMTPCSRAKLTAIDPGAGDPLEAAIN